MRRRRDRFCQQQRCGAGKNPHAGQARGLAEMERDHGSLLGFDGQFRRPSGITLTPYLFQHSAKGCHRNSKRKLGGTWRQKRIPNWRARRDSSYPCFRPNDLTTASASRSPDSQAPPTVPQSVSCARLPFDSGRVDQSRDLRDGPEPDVRAPLRTARVWARPIVIKAGYIRREAQHGILGGSRRDGQPRRTQDPSGVCGRSDCGSILAHARDDKRSDYDSIPARARAPAQADCSYESERQPYCRS